jgi:hypothetical protein
VTIRSAAPTEISPACAEEILGAKPYAYYTT